MEKKDIASYTLQELEDEMKAIGEKPFRAKQIYEWIHVKLVESFDEMTNVSKALREKLDREYEIATVSLVERQISGIDGTNKFLFELSDGNMIESVLMKYKHGNSICISSQVGYRMGCRFCASTIGGLVRNLTASEMLREVYEVQKISGERISNIVVMGTGEPLDNYENFVRFIRMVSDGHGLHISQRNITASTCGMCRISGAWRMRNFRSRWRFPFTDPTRRSGNHLCPWQINMSCLKSLRRVTSTLKRPEEGSRLSTVWCWT